jgi:hypothetical protein
VFLSVFVVSAAKQIPTKPRRNTKNVLELGQSWQI